MPGKAAQRGNTIVEYTLIGGVVIVASIIAFTLLGGHWQQFLAGLRDDMRQHPGQAANLGTQPAAANASAASQALPTLIKPGDITITLSNGTRLNVSGYPSDVNKSLQTMGANGTTEKLLGNLDTVIQQLVASGQVTPEQANLLQQLSNQGHKMGGIEALIENAMNNSNGSTTTFAQQTIMYNGKRYTPSQLASLIGADDPLKVSEGSAYTTLASINGTTFYAGDETAKFYSLLNQVNQLHLDPAALDTINVLSNQIGYVANGVQSGVGYVSYFTDTPLSQYTDMAIYWSSQENLMPGTAASLTDLPSATTHTAASGICNAGGQADTGTNCTAASLPAAG